MKGNLGFEQTQLEAIEDVEKWVQNKFKNIYETKINEEDEIIYGIENEYSKTAFIVITKRNEEDKIRIKMIPESWHPKRYDFPVELLKELDSPRSNFGEQWRKECEKYWEEKGIKIERKTTQSNEEDEEDEWGFDEEDKEDLELKDLGQYYATQQIWNLGGLLSKIKVTDGIKYVDRNGYGYLISDTIIAITMKCLNEQFLVVSFFKDEKGIYNLVISEDRSGENFIKIKHHQKYEWCSAKVESLKFYYENGTLLLASER